jgi:hypothetical protein
MSFTSAIHIIVTARGKTGQRIFGEDRFSSDLPQWIGTYHKGKKPPDCSGGS